MRYKDYRDHITYLKTLYRSIDSHIEYFRSETGLSCPENCGFCCQKPDLQATAFEFLPAALWLWENNKAGEALSKCEDAGGNGICVLFSPEEASKKGGCCSIYESRPLVCRLFGFSAVRNKFGKPLLAACDIIKSAQPAKYENALRMIEDGLKVPVMRDFSLRISGMGGVFSDRQVPINQAIRSAVENIGLALDFSTQEQKEEKRSPFASLFPGFTRKSRIRTF